MSIDLNKIIARKSYLVPIKASDMPDALLKELNVHEPWFLIAKHPRSASFQIDAVEKYATHNLAAKKIPRTPINIAKKRAEFEKDPIGCLDWLQGNLVEHLPYELSYVIAEELGIVECLINAVCRPILYSKVVRGLECRHIDERDIQLRTEEFLDGIFIGGLGAKEVKEKREVSSWKFLLNDANIRLITDRIYEMLNGATTCVLLMGWVGTDCIPLLRNLKNLGVVIKAITHKPSEMKTSVPIDVQKGYTELVELLGLENVSTSPLLHGRAIIVDNKALIGSMDLNSHSLSGNHVEFAIYTEDADTVRILRKQFESMFKPLKE